MTRGPEFEHCTSGCRVGGHRSYGDCLRGKNVAATGLESTGPGFAKSEQKSWDGELSAYAAARKQGIQPDSTKLKDVQRAVEVSNQTGKAYGS